MMKPSVKLGHLASELDLEHTGDPDIELTGIAPLFAACASDVSFLDNIKYRQYLRQTQAGVVILAASELDSCPTAALIADHPYYVYAKVARYF